MIIYKLYNLQLIIKYTLTIRSEHNYIFTNNGTLGTQLHVSALHIDRRQVLQ
jgi:hypothetical protein